MSITSTKKGAYNGVNWNPTMPQYMMLFQFSVERIWNMARNAPCPALDGKKESKFDLGTSVFENLNFPPNSCIPRSAKIYINKQIRMHRGPRLANANIKVLSTRCMPCQLLTNRIILKILRARNDDRAPLEEPWERLIIESIDDANTMIKSTQLKDSEKYPVAPAYKTSALHDDIKNNNGTAGKNVQITRWRRGINSLCHQLQDKLDDKDQGKNIICGFESIRKGSRVAWAFFGNLQSNSPICDQCVNWHLSLTFLAMDKQIQKF